METINLKDYCAQFLENQKLGELPFFKEESYTSSYRDLISLALSLAENLKKSPEQFYALQIESSYFLFAHLLASIFAGKNALILSSREPDRAVQNYQKNLSFQKVIKGVIGSNQFHHTLLDREINPEQVAFTILSSGSSGPSKGIPLTLNNIYHSARSLIDVFAMTSNDTTFLNLPHHHIGGMMILWRAFFSKGSVTSNNLDNFHFISLVPLQLKRSLMDPIQKEKLQNCRAVLIGGAPLDETLKNDALKNHIPVYETYGMSETSSLVLLNGKPLEGQEIKLDSEGHFLIKGPTLSPFVIRDPEGFFHTKDIGIQHNDGSFSFKHRSDLLFKSAGELIDPLLIEAKVKELPWIADAVSVPIKHPEWTWAQTLVYVSNDPEKTADDIKSYLKSELHPHYLPRFFYPAPESLIPAGIKPKRFEISRFAQEKYFKDLLNYLYIPNEKAKKLIVFFHGFMEDHSDMIPLMDSHQENASYLFIDFPGHGKSKSSLFKTRELVFYNISELIKFVAGEHPYVLYGYSMGGRIALELALDYLNPSLLIIESAHLGLATNEEKKNRLDLDRLLFKNADDLKIFFDSWYKNPIFADYNKSSQYHVDVEKKLDHSKEEWQNSLEFNSPGTSPYLYAEIIAKLHSLKLVAIVGSLDEKYKKHLKEAQKTLLNLELHEIKNAGHNPHKTHLTEVKRILSNLI